MACSGSWGGYGSQTPSLPLKHTIVFLSLIKSISLCGVSPSFMYRLHLSESVQSTLSTPTCLAPEIILDVVSTVIQGFINEDLN